MAKLINGKEFADNLCKKIAKEVAKLKDQNIIPGLAVVRVGEDSASKIYINMKAKKAEEIGMNSYAKLLSEDTDEKELIDIVKNLNNDEKVNGILVQLPLPKQINADSVINTIIPEKDVDGFHAINTGRLWTNIDALVPCTPLGCKMLLLNELKDLSGKKAIIVGTHGSIVNCRKLYCNYCTFKNCKFRGRNKKKRYCSCCCWSTRNDKRQMD